MNGTAHPRKDLESQGSEGYRKAMPRDMPPPPCVCAQISNRIEQTYLQLPFCGDYSPIFARPGPRLSPQIASISNSLPDLPLFTGQKEVGRQEAAKGLNAETEQHDSREPMLPNEKETDAENRLNEFLLTVNPMLDDYVPI